MEKWKLGVGLAHELEIMGNKTGWTNADVSKLASDEALNRKVLAVLRNVAEVALIPHHIDSDADPFVPEGLFVEEHIKGGRITWNASQIQLYLNAAQRQIGSNSMGANLLHQALKGRPVLNASVLDYLLAHPHIIPEEWKGKSVYFWGTIYSAPSGYKCVRCLYWHNDRWNPNEHWLGVPFYCDDYAALFVSQKMEDHS